MSNNTSTDFSFLNILVFSASNVNDVSSIFDPSVFVSLIQPDVVKKVELVLDRVLINLSRKLSIRHVLVTIGSCRAIIVSFLDYIHNSFHSVVFWRAHKRFCSFIKSWPSLNVIWIAKINSSIVVMPKSKFEPFLV